MAGIDDGLPQEEWFMALASALVAAAQAVRRMQDSRDEASFGNVLPDDYVSPLSGMAEVYMARFGVNEDELHASLAAMSGNSGDYYVKPRSLTWLDDFLMDTDYDEQRWHKNFRMSKDSFFDLVEQLTPYLEKQSTRWKPTGMVEPVKRVGIFLYRITHATDYFTLSEMFAIGCSTITEIMEVRFQECVCFRFAAKNF
jgi:hypothetical protein